MKGLNPEEVIDPIQIIISSKATIVIPRYPLKFLCLVNILICHFSTPLKTAKNENIIAKTIIVKNF